MNQRPTLTGWRWAFLLPVGLITYFWLPALWHGRLIIHGDSAHHGLSLLKLLRQALAGQESLLWSSRIYGGHPLFAESQGGFLNPLNILSAWLFEPVLALGFFHWLTMLVSAAGVFVLCRILGISRWAAVFAAIGVSFSGSWIQARHNLPISASLAWLPWLLAATEYWVRQPSTFRAGLLAIPAALLVFSGYPQIAHGAALYAITSLLAQFIQRETRVSTIRHWRAFLGTGLLAIVLAIGLSAIQFIPMLELVGQSHRSHGIATAFNGLLPPAFYLKGLVYYYFGSNPYGINLPNLANITVLLLASLLVLIRAPTRILGHALSTFLLFNLSLGGISPLFNLAYEHSLIPGLHYYRIMTPFFPVAVVGFCVIAAFILDALSGNISDNLWRVFQKQKVLLFAVLACLTCGLLYFCHQLYSPLYSPRNFLAPALFVTLFLVLGALGKRQWLPLCTVLILAVDVLTFRVHTIDFFDRTIIEQPDIVRAIAAEPDRQDFRVMDGSTGGLMTMLGPTDPSLAFNYRRLLTALSPFPMSLQWKIPSINGVLALPLLRRTMLDLVLEAEVNGTSGNRTGLRLIDILGVRYISRDAPLANPGLALYAQDREHNVFIYRNATAKPRFQVYSNARSVGTPEQALAGLQAESTETLFIEMPTAKNLTQIVPCPTCAAPRIKVVEAMATRYKVNVEVAQDAWLFLADANYPGWQATVNGVEQTVYSAQVLGKAIRLKPGRNAVVIQYVPWSFYGGAALSGATALLLILIFFINIRNSQAAQSSTRRKTV
ncbi:MAG TPA: YfhO family protein [Rhodocyclaceae bacterium]|nr:YfhO family protein [Rhodocyclaceae bacterium]